VRRRQLEPSPAAGALIGRRAFLGIVGVGASSVLWGQDAAAIISHRLRGLTAALPDELRAAFPAPGTGWRIYSVSPPTPRFDPVTWRLRIDGLVERPVVLTYGDLLALPQARQVSDFRCVTGWSVPGVHWGGVRFSDLLATARPLPSARAITFVSSEQPYVDSLTLAQLAAPDAMVACLMDGKPLSREHGAPARVVMPRMYGYKGVKWLERIVLTDGPILGYWEQRGYDLDAWIGRSNGYA
jgi:DMSO/TMAO reductase YedYZ molybdopterin-dependent catalytic subunit